MGKYTFSLYTFLLLLSMILQSYFPGIIPDDLKEEDMDIYRQENLEVQKIFL